MDNKSIAEYFILENKNLEFSITKPINGRYSFTINYKKKYIPKHDFMTLPEELNDIINSYLDDFIIIEIVVDLRHNYPFSKPNWNLVNVKDSYDNRLPLKLFNYYKYIVNKHNKMYTKKNWSPIIDIKNDILIFITRINHFEIFDEY